ncbi:cobalamin biosynthesis protein CobD [Prosthecochloris sp. GSB1]|uniref:adenosylcobinamide-phosphate synthase CbiB n=1 Tax=Prosthecochloris sp. GSB1 TaxID=281093 RepID=UPI000B8CECAB|nr:adenosylcobinamide-phosphate synthase CbiB [Prosthecochloris sp. GSB1]ASQ90389.1 cobalamin biosynthesis protein CobD [Prosthecochloris sp. GSB1]
MTTVLMSLVQFVAAFLLDLLLGDPRGWPHPVRFIGRLATWSETVLRRLSFVPLRFAGGITVFVVVFVPVILAWSMLHAAFLLHPLFGAFASVVMLASTIAARDLAGHARAVLAALEAGDLPGAREKVGMMVGRDTAQMSEQDVVRATAESVAENTVDGVTAPLFYALLFGPVGAVAYKAVNTLDSSFGYKNERYREFGWASAKIDDLFNYLPSRLTVAALVPAAFLLRLRYGEIMASVRNTAPLHASPNAGYSEAAFAGALGVRFGGPRSYGGRRLDLPGIGCREGTPDIRTVREAVALMFAGSAVFLATGLVVLATIEII